MIPRKQEPPDPAKVAKSQLPPVFRTSLHTLARSADFSRRGDEKPPAFKAGELHSSLDPGRRVAATDREYIVGQGGELRRAISNRGRHSRRGRIDAAYDQRWRDSQVAAVRIVGELSSREEKRAKGRLRRKLERATALQARATTLQRQIAAHEASHG